MRSGCGCNLLRALRQGTHLPRPMGLSPAAGVPARRRNSRGMSYLMNAIRTAPGDRLLHGRSAPEVLLTPSGSVAESGTIARIHSKLASSSACRMWFRHRVSYWAPFSAIPVHFPSSRPDVTHQGPCEGSHRRWTGFGSPCAISTASLVASIHLDERDSQDGQLRHQR